jgi:predicted nucleic acid-binding protein
VDGLGLLQSTAVDTSEPALPDLDEGKPPASAWLALSRREPVLLLINETAGRAVAQELGITVAGTAAVIGMAHRRGLISLARDVFAALHASDFRIAPAVIQAVPDRCGNAAPIDGEEPPTAQSG